MLTSEQFAKNLRIFSQKLTKALENVAKTINEIDAKNKELSDDETTKQ